MKAGDHSELGKVSNDSDATNNIRCNGLGVNEHPLSPINEWFLQLFTIQKQVDQKGFYHFTSN